jgi:4-methylaminobutanoate oxidase (formaldehyde-forming)
MGGVYDEIAAAGKAFNLIDAGYRALNSLRLEKGYRHWGHDIADEDSPLAAGPGFVVKLDKKSGFIGREALLRQREQGLKRRLVQFRLRDPEPLLYHNEPIWHGKRIVGHITSAAYGHTLGGSIGLGYVKGLDGGSSVGDGYEIEVAGEIATSRSARTSARAARW